MKQDKVLAALWLLLLASTVVGLLWQSKGGQELLIVLGLSVMVLALGLFIVFTTLWAISVLFMKEKHGTPK